MTDLKLTPEPTFEAPVKVHVPGKGEVEMTWTFKYRDADEMAALCEKMQAKGRAAEKSKKRATRADLIAATLDIASGWSLEEAFTEKNLDTFFLHYPKSFIDIQAAYFEEYKGARRKN
jgi:hypothetical protein